MLAALWTKVRLLSTAVRKYWKKPRTEPNTGLLRICRSHGTRRCHKNCPRKSYWKKKPDHNFSVPEFFCCVVAFVLFVWHSLIWNAVITRKLKCCALIFRKELVRAIKCGGFSFLHSCLFSNQVLVLLDLRHVRVSGLNCASRIEHSGQLCSGNVNLMRLKRYYTHLMKLYGKWYWQKQTICQT